MKRRIIPFLVSALAVVLAASCDPHHFPSDGQDFSLRLQFKLEVPAWRTVEAQTTKAGGKAVARPAARYTVQLHRYTEEYPYTEAPTYTFTFLRDELEDLDTTVFLPVDPDRYKVLAWTDYVDGRRVPYWDATDFNEITLLDYSGDIFARDAFRGAATLDLSGLRAAGTHRELVLEMTRPVARLRVIIPDGMGYLSSKGLSAASLLSTLRWETAVADRYDLFSDRPWGALQGAKLTSGAFLDDDGALVLCMDHVLTGTESLTGRASFSFGLSGGETLGTWTGELPLLRGHLTTLVLRPTTPTPPGPGDEDADAKGGVGIDPVFDSETEITF